MSSLVTPTAAICAVTRTTWQSQTGRLVALPGIYPGLAIDVLDGDGNAVAGNTKLGTIRDSYADE